MMVVHYPPRIEFVLLDSAIHRQRLVPTDSNAVITARALDICFGD